MILSFLLAVQNVYIIQAWKIRTSFDQVIQSLAKLCQRDTNSSIIYLSCTSFNNERQKNKNFVETVLEMLKVLYQGLIRVSRFVYFHSRANCDKPITILCSDPNPYVKACTHRFILSLAK